MSRSQLYLGGAPPEEDDIAQTVSPDYGTRSRRECRAWMHQLHRRFHRAVQAGCTFRIISENQGSFSLRDVVVEFDPDNSKQVNQAFNVEANLPRRWDAAARAELKGMT